jgi:hypothetical protein
MIARSGVASTAPLKPPNGVVIPRNLTSIRKPRGGRLLIVENTIPFARRSATAAWVRAVNILSSVTKVSSTSETTAEIFGVSSILRDMPKHVLITSAAMTKSDTIRSTHFALVCNSKVPIEMGGRAYRFSNLHYKNLSKDGKLGKSARGQRTTTALVRWTSSPISGAECDSIIDFSADLRAPYCVELSDPKQIPRSAVATLNQQVANGLRVKQWTIAVTNIRR